jgi:hypothetical protein
LKEYNNMLEITDITQIMSYLILSYLNSTWANRMQRAIHGHVPCDNFDYSMALFYGLRMTSTVAMENNTASVRTVELT